MNADLLNEMLKNAPVIRYEDFILRRPIPHIRCEDGTTLSVQAGEHLYCAPRNNEGPWVEVEVGFPSVSPPDSWKEYFDGNWDTDDHTGSVYGYIPIDLVVDFINDHGGLKETIPIPQAKEQVFEEIEVKDNLK